MTEFRDPVQRANWKADLINSLLYRQRQMFLEANFIEIMRLSMDFGTQESADIIHGRLTWFAIKTVYIRKKVNRKSSGHDCYRNILSSHM